MTRRRQVMPAPFPGCHPLVVFQELAAHRHLDAVGEHGKQDDRIRLLTLKHKKIVLDKITELARSARPGNPKGLTRELNLRIDGAIVAALITHDPNVADHARNAAARLMEHG